MSNIDRRRFLKVLTSCGAGAAAAMGGPVLRALADMPKDTEFFVFILASGGTDVTLWSDPRNQTKGLVNPASTGNTDVAVLPDPDLWKPTPLDAKDDTFQILTPPGNTPFQFGPGIGRLFDHADRLCLINGIAMNTVSHPDGKAFSSSGRHLAGGHPAASSIDTMVANELGVGQLLPNVSILFPSAYVGSTLDPRAAPLLVDSVGTIAKSLSRSSLYDSPAERDMVNAALSAEATDLAAIANDPRALQAMALNYGSLKKMLDPAVQPTFSSTALMTALPDFFNYGTYKPKFQADAAVNAAFAVQAMKLNLVRSVSFSLNAFDTHNSNYQFHLQTLQEGMNVIANLITVLDKTPHPTLSGHMLSEHTHIMMVSDFCRTPQINVAGGRDHYPNNSTLIISPMFKQKYLFSGTDSDQVLPMNVGDPQNPSTAARANVFSDGPRPISPPDVLRTFLSAFGIDPAKYVRDGQVVPQLLAGGP
jgi:hypothetical protein